MLEVLTLTLLIRAELFCSKVDPTRVGYCKEEVVECYFDESGEQWYRFCEEDYVDVEGLKHESN